MASLFTFQLTSLALPQVFAAGLCLIAIGFLWPIRRESTAARWLFLVLASATLWSFAGALEFSARDVSAKIFWTQVSYAGIAISPFALFHFAYVHTQDGRLPRRIVSVIMGVIGLLILLSALTNGLHGWHWPEVTATQRNGLVFALYDRGPMFWLTVIYCYGFMFASSVMLAAHTISLGSIFRQQALLIILATLAPWITSLAYVLRIGPLPELDHTPVGFAITAMLLCWAVVRIRLFEIVPVAANTLFLRIPDPVLVTDPAGRLVRANDAALRRFGTLDRHIGRPLAEAFTGHPEIVSAILAAETHPERRTTLSSGATWWTIGSNALEESGKRQQGRLVILRDITEQKRTELQLLQAKVELEQTLARADALAREAVAANNAKSSFLTQVSHDLRTPLHAILGMTEVLRAGPLGTAQQAEVATISDAGDALLRLINDLLDLSRIEAGRIDLAHDPFLIDDVLDQIADLLGPAARRKGLGFVHWIEPGLPGGLRGDSGRLRQILINLVGNAVKFTERGGITIRVSRKDILLGIEISDTGRGISPGHLPGLFTPFNRGDPEAARHTEGTGLGLAISRRLAEAMGGVINVRSTPGQGTAFTLELPIVDDGATPVLFSRIASQVAGRRITVAISDPGRRTAVIQGLLSLGASAHPLGREQPPGSVPLVVDDAEEAAGLVAEWRAAGSTVVIAAGAQARPSPAAVPLTRRSLASALLSAAASTAAGASPTVPSGPRRRVLLADDNPLSLRVSAAQLAQCNCTVDTATGGLCALERLATQDYDLVVLDGQMPDLNGWEVAFRIRQGPKDARNARTPVIALTADLTPDSHLRWLNAGTAVVLGKPVRTRELCEIIERCCPKTS